MKRYSLFVLVALAACNSKNGTVNNQPVHACYLDTTNKNKIGLQVDITADSVTGNLEYGIYQKDLNKGKVAGIVKDDTFLLDYTFLSEGTTSVRQVAFKKSGDTLFEGYGEVDEQNGKMIFKNPSALQFRGGVVLIKSTCP